MSNSARSCQPAPGLDSISPRSADASPRLLADLSPTHVRFALQTAGDELTNIETLNCGDYPGIEDAIRAYLARVGTPQIAHAAIGLNQQAHGDWVHIAEPHWGFSVEATRQALGFTTLLLVNRIGALANSLPQQTLLQIGAGTAQPDAPRALLGAADVITLAKADGQLCFALFDERAARIPLHTERSIGQLSFEQLLSGQGLEHIHAALAQQAGKCAPALHTAEIIERSTICLHSCAALQLFCSLLASVAADVALSAGARGGVYLCGDIATAFGAYRTDPLLHTRHEGEALLLSSLGSIPVYLLTSTSPTLVGTGIALAEHLAQHDRSTR